MTLRVDASRSKSTPYKFGENWYYDKSYFDVFNLLRFLTRLI